MKTKQFIFYISLLSLTILMVLIFPVLSYVFRIQLPYIPDDPETLSLLSDYFSGVSNTLLAAINTVLIVALAFYVYKLESRREQTFIAISLKPIFELFIGLSNNELSIKLKNIGTGPGKILNMEVRSTQENGLNGLSVSIFKIPPPSFSREEITLCSVQTDPGTFLGTGDEVTLLSIVINGKDSDSKDYLFSVVDIVSKTEVVIEYCDIFEEKMPNVERRLKPLIHREVKSNS